MTWRCTPMMVWLRCPLKTTLPGQIPCPYSKPLSLHSIRHHGFQLIRRTPPTFPLEAFDLAHQEAADQAIVTHLKSGQVFLRGGVGVQRQNGALVELVEGVRGIAAEQPDIRRFAVFPGQAGAILI